jgi:hypothetical protein
MKQCMTVERKALLYADVLGIKALWNTAEIDQVKRAFDRFEQMVEQALRARPPRGPVAGGLQSDAVALVFDDTSDAVRVGIELFRNAFDAATAEERMWLRGVICPVTEGPERLVVEQALQAQPELTVRRFSDEMLEAINTEQRFKGARLLICDALVDDAVAAAVAIQARNGTAVPLRKLEHSPLPPPSSSGDWQEIMYLVPDPYSLAAVEDRTTRMQRRLRWAASRAHRGSTEEFTHVAMLAAVWAECEAIARRGRWKDLDGDAATTLPVAD